VAGKRNVDRRESVNTGKKPFRMSLNEVVTTFAAMIRVILSFLTRELRNSSAVSFLMTVVGRLFTWCYSRGQRIMVKKAVLL
jgi:hypothetical protein